jgi:hypothetical protein
LEQKEIADGALVGLPPGLLSTPNVGNLSAYTLPIVMENHRQIAFPEISQSTIHMLMYYLSCRLEAAGKWFRSCPEEVWPESFRKHLETDTVRNIPWNHSEY